MIRKKRKFFSPIGYFRPTCNGMCLTDHADGDIVHISYCLYIFPVIVFCVFEWYNVFTFIHPVLWAFCILFWLGSLYFLSATYLTEPGLIPKGAPLTPEQIRSISETPSQRLLRQVFICIKDGNYSRLEELLDHTPSLVRESNNEGRTALHIAAFRGDYVACDRILHHGARVCPDVYSLTPLHYAAFEGAEDVVDLLLKHMHDLESSIALADPDVEGDESDDGDGGCLDSDNVLDLMKNKVVCELGPDYASPRGECTMLPPYSGIPRSIVFDGHVVSCAICRQCCLNLPPRAQHCRFCECCVMKFDHHCPWVSNCIGLRNHRCFVALLVCSVLFLLLSVVLIGLLLFREAKQAWAGVKEERSVWKMMLPHWFAGVLGLIDVVALVPMTMLCWVHLMLVAKNMTTQEYRRANYRFVSNPVYDKGVWKNIKNELFTYHPSLLATTLHSNKRTDIERRRSFTVS